MKNVATLAVLALMSAPALAEEEATQVKVYVKGMTCPNGCGTAIAKGLAATPGAKDVKLADFEKGLFTLSVDAKNSVKPSDLKKSLGKFEIAKIEVTMAGTVSQVKDQLVLQTASGQKYGLAAAKCDETKKEDSKCEDATAKIAAWLREGKTAIKVSGSLGECCEGEITIAVASAQPVERKPAN